MVRMRSQGVGGEESRRRTLGILPPGDVDELLDVADFLGLQTNVERSSMAQTVMRTARTILSKS